MDNSTNLFFLFFCLMVIHSIEIDQVGVFGQQPIQMIPCAEIPGSEACEYISSADTFSDLVQESWAYYSVDLNGLDFSKHSGLSVKIVRLTQDGYVFWALQRNYLPNQHENEASKNFSCSDWHCLDVAQPFIGICNPPKEIWLIGILNVGQKPLQVSVEITITNGDDETFDCKDYKSIDPKPRLQTILLIIFCASGGSLLICVVLLIFILRSNQKRKNQNSASERRQLLRNRSRSPTNSYSSSLPKDESTHYTTNIANFNDPNLFYPQSKFENPNYNLPEVHNPKLSSLKSKQPILSSSFTTMTLLPSTSSANSSTVYTQFGTNDEEPKDLETGKEEQ